MKRQGFTLVELLVVIAIIVMLVALLLPAVQNARAGARKVQCENNQREISTAMLSYALNKGSFPGYRVSQNGTTSGNPISWVFPVTQYLDRKDLYVSYGPGGSQSGAAPTEHLKIAVCPDDTDALNNGTQISYVVNAGMTGNDESATGKGIGVFWDGYPTTPPARPPVKIGPSYISSGDGMATTLMLTENVDAVAWTSEAEGHVAFVLDDPTDPISRINSHMTTKKPAEREGTYPRPSSYHGDGVIMTFCDHHVKFINDNIDPQVLQLLMSPRGAACNPVQTRLISEGDY